MTIDQIYKLLVSTPVTLDHALAAMGEVNMEMVLRNPNKRTKLFETHAELASDHAAQIATVADDLEYVWGPQEDEPE